MPPWWPGRNRNKFSADYLAGLCSDVMRYNENPSTVKQETLIENVRQMAEILVWGDANDEASIFDTFLERNMLPHLTELLSSSAPPEVKVQLIQTLYIIIQNLKSLPSIFYLLSENHINKVIMNEALWKEFEGDEELLTNFINFLKSLSLRLDVHTIQCFYNRDTDTFPLYLAARKFLSHREALVRAAARAIIVHMCKVDDKYVLNYVLQTAGYMQTVFKLFEEELHLLSKQTRGFKKSLTGQGVPPTLGEVSVLCDDIVDDLYYFNDLLQIERAELFEALFTSATSFCVRLLSEEERKEEDEEDGQQALPHSVALFAVSLWLPTLRHPVFARVVMSALCGTEAKYDVQALLNKEQPQEEDEEEEEVDLARSWLCRPLVFANMEEEPQVFQAAISLILCAASVPPGLQKCSGLQPRGKKEICSGVEIPVFPNAAAAAAAAPPLAPTTASACNEAAPWEAKLPEFLRVEQAEPFAPLPDEVEENPVDSAYPARPVGKLLRWICLALRDMRRYGRLDTLEAALRCAEHFCSAGDGNLQLIPSHAVLFRDAYRTATQLIVRRLVAVKEEVAQRAKRAAASQPLPPPSIVHASSSSSSPPPSPSPSPSQKQYPHSDPHEILFLHLSCQSLPLFQKVRAARDRELSSHYTVVLPLVALPAKQEEEEEQPESPPCATSPPAPPSADPVPGAYRVTGRSGAMVRKEESLESKLLTRLRQGAVVEVAEIRQRRCRISKPLEGWISVWNSVGEKIIQPLADADAVAAAAVSPPRGSSPVSLPWHRTLPLEKRCPANAEELAKVEEAAFMLVRRAAFTLTGREDTLPAHLDMPEDGPHLSSLGEEFNHDLFPNTIRCQTCPALGASRDSRYALQSFYSNMGVLLLHVGDAEVLLLQEPQQQEGQAQEEPSDATPVLRLVAACPLISVHAEVDLRLNYRLNLRCRSFSCVLSFEKAPACQQVATKVNIAARALRQAKTYTLCSALKDDCF